MAAVHEPAPTAPKAGGMILCNGRAIPAPTESNRGRKAFKDPMYFGNQLLNGLKCKPGLFQKGNTGIPEKEQCSIRCCFCFDELVNLGQRQDINSTNHSDYCFVTQAKIAHDLYLALTPTQRASVLLPYQLLDSPLWLQKKIDEKGKEMTSFALATSTVQALLEKIYIHVETKHCFHPKIDDFRGMAVMRRMAATNDPKIEKWKQRAPQVRERRERLVNALYVEDEEEKAQRQANKLSKLQRRLKSLKAQIAKLTETVGSTTPVKKRRSAMGLAHTVKKKAKKVKTDKELAELKKGCEQGGEQGKGKEWVGMLEGPKV